MEKTIELGKVDGYGNGRRSCAAEVTVCLEETPRGERLAIQGAIWNSTQTDILSGGQNVDTMVRLVRTPKMARIAEVWRRWHLNDMRAGCAHQRGQAHEVGDLCESCGYRYGHSWLYEELPADIVAEVESW